MKKLLIVLLLLLLVGCNKTKKVVDPIDNNNRVFYEIFTGSFSDSNGDGIGDLQGIINRLDYLNDGDINSNKSLGIQGIWLTPIFKSPSYHKYDAEDYYEIDPDFGSQEDLDKLIEECHKRNILLILDLAINHTSGMHEWFNEFYKAHQNNDTSNKYYDYYTYDTQFIAEPGKAWCDITNAGQVYECNFSYDMPELNFNNPEVRQEVLDIAKFYLDKGIDGFRFDAAKYIYFNDNGKSIDFWDWYTSELRKIKEDIYLVGEVWSSETETSLYIKDMNCFNFTMGQAEGVIATAGKGNDINIYTSYVVNYQNKIKDINPNAIAIPFIANHDMDRAAGYLTVFNGRAYMGASLLLLSPGSPFIYYGEEIGMKGSRGSANTDANRRLAMLWGDDDTIKDPEGTTFDPNKQVNGTVKEQIAQETSLYNHYRKLIALRVKYPLIGTGNYTQLNLNDKHVGGFVVEEDGETIYIVHNNSDGEITVKDDRFKELCDYVGLNSASLNNSELTIGAKTSVILK